MPSLKNITHFLGATALTSVVLTGSAFAQLAIPDTCGSFELLSASDQNVLTAADLEGLSNTDLRFARNEIFARHGYKFESFDLRQWFRGCDWYERSDDPLSLSDIEEQNVALIRAAEKENTLPLPGESYTARLVIDESDTLYPFWAGKHFMFYQDGRLGLELISPESEYGKPKDRVIQLHDFGGGGVEVPLLYGGGDAQADVAEYSVEEEFGTIYAAGRYPFLLSPLTRTNPTIKRESSELDGRAVTRYEILGSDTESEYTSGSVWVTDRGIIMKADLAGRFAPEGQEDYQDWSIKYHLEELKHRPIDPVMFAIPDIIQGFNAPG